MEVERHLQGHFREVRAAGRLLRETPAVKGAPHISPDQVVAYRWRASHLDRRMKVKDIVEAAAGGLQDSAPRAGLLSLHARLRGATPQSWEDPRLAQIWFRRADYIVPLQDLGVFTLGCLPRDAQRRVALETLTESVLARLAEGTASGADPLVARWAQVTGRFIIRWDASRTTILPHPTPDMDPEEARLELARRFLRWYAPATVGQFAKWSAAEYGDAVETWQKLSPELAQVDVFGFARDILRVNLDSLLSAQPMSGTRLLPGSDPYLAVDSSRLFPFVRNHPVQDALRKDHPPRLINSLSGRIVIAGEIVGSWGRVGSKVTVVAWTPIAPEARADVEAEAANFSAPIGTPISIRWLAPQHLG